MSKTKKNSKSIIKTKRHSYLRKTFKAIKPRVALIKRKIPIVRDGLEKVGESVYYNTKQAMPAIKNSAKNALSIAQNTMANIFNQSRSALRKKRLK